MITAIDAHYRDEVAAVACVSFDNWTDVEPMNEVATLVHDIAPYKPGEFWRRELPCVLAVLELLDEPPSIIVVDGYVWLDGNGRKGLGAHLFEALDGRTAIVGVAKHIFQGAAHAAHVLRGSSARPLLVTAEGMMIEDAAAAVASMYGEFRLPTLLKRADQLCRKWLEDEARSDARLEF